MAEMTSVNCRLIRMISYYLNMGFAYTCYTIMRNIAMISEGIETIQKSTLM